MFSRRSADIRNHLERIVASLPVLVPAEPDPPSISHFRPPIPIANLRLQNAMEERPPFGFLLPRIALNQLQHGLLYEVVRILVMARGNLCHTECTAFDRCQEPVEGQTVQS